MLATSLSKRTAMSSRSGLTSAFKLISKNRGILQESKIMALLVDFSIEEMFFEV